MVNRLSDGELWNRLSCIGHSKWYGSIMTEIVNEAQKEIYETALKDMITFEDGIEVNAQELAKVLMKWFGDPKEP